MVQQSIYEVQLFLLVNVIYATLRMHRKQNSPCLHLCCATGIWLQRGEQQVQTTNRVCSHAGVIQMFHDKEDKYKFHTLTVL
jgi:hypothetical protein